MNSLLDLFKRVIIKNPKDPFSIANEAYNEHNGSLKVMIVEPVVKAAVGVNDIIAYGSYVKVTGTSYTLRNLGNDHNAAKHYIRNSLVVQAGKIYRANENINPEAFDVTKWTEVANATIGPITVEAGALVCSGKYHNNINAAGFIVEDDTVVRKAE